MAFNVGKHPGGVLVIEVEGQLIVGNRQELKQRVLDALEAGSRKFLIDFTKTGYIDSSGLGVLVSLSKKIRDEGGDLRLAGRAHRRRTRGRCRAFGHAPYGLVRVLRPAGESACRERGLGTARELP